MTWIMDCFDIIISFMVNCDSECCNEDDVPYLYPESRGILYAVKDSGIDVAIASRSPTSDIAKTFLDKLGIQSMTVAQVSF